jgi:glycosyltransferase involved in cell wall biosynthesis
LDIVGEHPPIRSDGVTGHGLLRRDVPEQRRIVEELFGTATCFVMPSHLEAAGIVYLEAASAGTPVIGTKNGGSAWLIGDGGTVVDPTNDDELVDAMRRFADPVVAAHTGAIGRARAASFTWTAVARRLADALSGKPPEPWTAGPSTGT